MLSRAQMRGLRPSSRVRAGQQTGPTRVLINADDGWAGRAPGEGCQRNPRRLNLPDSLFYGDGNVREGEARITRQQDLVLEFEALGNHQKVKIGERVLATMEKLGISTRRAIPRTATKQ
jgi:hypothetical protein